MAAMAATGNRPETMHRDRRLLQPERDQIVLQAIRVTGSHSVDGHQALGDGKPEEK